MRWRERGGWPLAVAAISLAAGVVFGVHTVQVEAPPAGREDTPVAPSPTITTDEFVAQVASAVADELHLSPRQRHRVVEVLADQGTPGAVIVEPPPTTTSTTTTTTTEPPPPTTRPTITVDPSLVPDVADVARDALGTYTYPGTTVP